MGVLFDYFAAVDDSMAASVIDRDGGPGAAAASPTARKSWFGRRNATAPPAGGDALLTVADAGFDPVVQATTLEELLTGASYDEISERPGWARSVATAEGGERMVVALSRELVTALATADDESLAAVVGPWSRTDEFWGAGDADELLPILRDLAALARTARGEGQSLYCWTCV